MRTILITDDQEGVPYTLAYVFGQRGYRTLLAKSGPVALEIARCELLDAALIDLHMPVMDGFTACQSLRAVARENGRALPVWLMTGAFTTAAAAKATEVGAIALIKKPFDCEELMRDMEGRFTSVVPTAPSPEAPRADQVPHAA